MNNYFKNILGNNWIELAARWILGLTFIYASYHKLLAPEQFAKIVYGYKLFPAALINLVAIILPFMELIAGLALILGVYPRSAALIVNFLLIAFIVILSINLIRNHEFDCGCFAFEEYGQSSNNQSLILRDIGYLILGVHILFYKNTRKACILDTGT